MSAAQKINEQPELTTISLPAMIQNGGDLDKQISQWKESSAQIFVLDFKDVRQFDEKAYRPFVLFQQGLKAANRYLFAINLSRAISLQFSQDGLTGVFVAVKDVNEAATRGGRKAIKPESLDTTFINPFIAAAQNVLKVQANTESRAGKPSIKDAQNTFPMEIAGVINLSNPRFTGSIALCFQSAVFLQIYENMVGEKHSSISQEVEDAAGELLNMIFGQAKAFLNDKEGFQLEKALPTILSGEKIKVRQRAAAPVILLPFESDAGPFHIEIVVDRS